MRAPCTSRSQPLTRKLRVDRLRRVCVQNQLKLSRRGACPGHGLLTYKPCVEHHRQCVGPMQQGSFQRVQRWAVYD